jgi:exopolyphosphatase/guanosine-5'-triphosphate,3'-diphosphate pyrophosphatase
MATLVRAHRRKFPLTVFKALPAKARLIEHLAVLVRLAVLVHRSRADVPELTLTGQRRRLDVRFPPGWLEAHPLTAADLQEEVEFLNAADFELRVQGVAGGNG